MKCLVQGHNTTQDLAIESDALPAELSVLSSSLSVGARLFVQQHVRPVKKHFNRSVHFLLVNGQTLFFYRGARWPGG